MSEGPAVGGLAALARRRRLYLRLAAIGILGVVGAIGWAYLQPDKMVSRMVDEFRHRNDYVPAKFVKLGDAGCRTWLVITRCSAKVTLMRGGQTKELTFWHFGQPDDVPIEVVQRHDDPQILTTVQALSGVGRRLVLLAAWPLGCATAATAFLAWRRRRARRRAEPASARFAP